MRTNQGLHTSQAVIDEITAGDGRSCTVVARQFPAHSGNSPHLDPSTIWRWCYHGVELPNGKRLRLEAARMGGRVLTSDQTVRRFIERQACLAESEVAHAV